MKHVLLMSLLLLSAMVSAQGSNDSPYIEVNGRSERSIAPDEIFLKVMLSAEKTSTYKTLETRAIKALMKIGIAHEDITLADAQGNEVSSWFKSSFETQRLLLIKVITAKEVGRVMEELHDLGVKEISIAKIDYSKKEELMNELRVEAMKNAKQKSTLMLAAVDARLGMPLSVRENSWGSRVMYDNVMLSGMSRSKSSESAVSSISFKKLDYKSEVTVRFEILNELD